MLTAILNLKFPFELKDDQIKAVNAWLSNNFRGSIIYSTGTGKTEIAFECARRLAEIRLAKDASSPAKTTRWGNPKEEFRILFLVPRIVLIEQNVNRLAGYGLPRESVGTFFGEKKDIREITIGTYQSIINHLRLLKDSDMLILDEIHLLSESAKEFSKIFDILKNDPTKAVLGLTATINENDPRYNTIIKALPPVKKYMIKDAVIDGRLAKPQIVSVPVSFTESEKKIYIETTNKISFLSRKLGAYDPKKISILLFKGGYNANLAKLWFANVRKRKELLSSASNKMLSAVNIVRKHPSEPIMIFSETIDSILKIEKTLESCGIPSRSIHNKIPIAQRKKILEEWGKEYFPLLSVHTLEIGYDIPDVRIAIIISNSSNFNQVAQRIGRVIRKTIRKNYALIYVIYVRDSKDISTLRMVKSTVEFSEADNQLKLTSFKS
ncbi:MAG TPA: DEAD/DEAH box helicase family protein [Nitrososphaeraceae archaeon]|nr:DEAD/DEAH box helicase family protein [Nitrososphaeraceae archaeon]